MIVKLDIARYNDQYIRFATGLKSDLLLNTLDVCRILSITVRPPAGVLSEACMNIEGIIETALSKSVNDTAFVRWLEETFDGYGWQTAIFPSCATLWDAS